MTWSQQADTPWDGGSTLWDVQGNTSITYWDKSLTPYLNTVNDTESVWDGGASNWDVIGNVVITNWDVRGSQWDAVSTVSTTWNNV